MLSFSLGDHNAEENDFPELHRELAPSRHPKRLPLHPLREPASAVSSDHQELQAEPGS